MSFHASNDQITIHDTNGDLVFDTSHNIPHILGTFEGSVSHDFIEAYGTEVYFNFGALPVEANFVLCRAVCTPTNLTTGLQGGGIQPIEIPYSNGAIENVPWNTIAPNEAVFFQGSLMLESGYSIQWSVDGYPTPGMYCRRVLNIEQIPEWGNSLVAWFHASTKYGFDAIPPLARVRWDVNFKVWYGKFRE